MSPKLSCLDCGKPTARSRCEDCQAIYLEGKPKRFRPATARGYDYQWQQVRLLVLHRDGWVCQYCNKKLIGSDATADHITPLSRGGDRYSLNNLRSACRSCNSSKRDK